MTISGLILVTTPTGRIGRRLVRRLLERDTALRVIVRDPARLDPEVRSRVDVVVGTHDDQAVLETHYLSFARVAAHAIRQHAVPRVVAVSSAGHGWPKPAGVLSAAFAMDDERSRTGAAYRGLSAPFFMDNILGQARSIREHGIVAFPNAADRPLATVATRDIADAAAVLLADRTWSGQEHVPVFGPNRLTPTEMAQVMSDEVGLAVTFLQLAPEEMASALAARGATAGVVRDILETTIAVDAGIYDADQGTASSGPTTSARGAVRCCVQRSSDEFNGCDPSRRMLVENDPAWAIEMKRAGRRVRAWSSLANGTDRIHFRRASGWKVAG